jgi:hypothetical protein
MTVPCTRCRHGEQQAQTDDLLLSVIDHKPLRTNTIDQLPPWRARTIVKVCLRAGAQLEHGDPDLFDLAARTAGRQDASQTGWWRAALGMDPRPEPYVPPPAGPYQAPAGWTMVSGGSGHDADRRDRHHLP